jgi:murein L,D-transpeptidase YcbB/YkuD
MFRLFFIFSFLYIGMANAQSVSESIKQWTAQNKSLQKLGKYLIQADSVKLVYEKNQYQPIWIEDNALSSAAFGFIEVLRNPNEFGFAVSDFIDPQLDQLILNTDKKASTLFWLEILLTDKWIQMSKYLYLGRLADYYILDDDTKLPKKSFNRWDELASTLLTLNEADQVRSALLKMEPKNRIYKSLKHALARLLKAEAEKNWKALVLPKEKLALGSQHEFIKDLKIQMINYGFAIDSIDSIFDDNLNKQIALFHKYYKTGENGITAGLARSLGYSAESRKEKIFLAMEKARMLSDNFEPNHIFVNLAFQEFKLFENSELVIEMKTINGQKFRRTPTMKDLVTVVELNPTWTVPYSIAVKDKLPKLKVNPGYLTDHNMTLYDSSGAVVDPESVDWSSITKTNFSYRIVQGSGNENALGLVKFPLTNPWAIYLHDTNERNLFSKNQRLLSSGCIRLEKPFVLAEYLLRDQPSYDIDGINKIVKAGLNSANDPQPTRIRVKKALPVYATFITTDIAADGVVRFADDIYGSDLRLSGILRSKDSALTDDMDNLRPQEVTDGLQAIPENKSVIGFLGTLNGNHVSKIVKLYKCVKNKRNSCELKYALDFNKNYTVESGDYIAIFENQIHADILSLSSRTTKLIKMTELHLPDVLIGESRVRVFHDLNASVEQRRILLENYYFSKSPLKFSQYDFGDYYLSSLGMKVMNERIDYSMCLTKGISLTEEAADVCKVYNSASSPEGLYGLFVFGATSLTDKYSDGEYTQSWLSKPGDRVKISHKRRLLAAPMAGSGTILVFPGSYKARGDLSAKTIAIKAGAVN